MKKLEIELTNLAYEYLKKDLEEYFKKRYKMDITIEDLAAAIVTGELLELHHEK